MTDNGHELPTLTQLRADLRKAAADLGDKEIRYLVDVYYQLQEYRKRAANQGRAGGEAQEPIGAVVLILAQFAGMEQAIKSALDKWSDSDPLAAWAKAQHGIGPVIASGLRAHIDIERAQTAGAVWRFAGLDPTLKWSKGQKRPYNARLKVLCWKAGESFKKFHNNERCFYGHLYAERKALEVERNEAGGNSETAAKTLAERKIQDAATRAIYEAGKLPAGRLDLRATRYATKLFLAHFWEEGRRQAALPIPAPYPIAHLGHAHKIEIPT